MPFTRRSVRSTSRAVGSRAVAYAASATQRRFRRHQIERALTDVRMTDPGWVDVGSRTIAAAAAAGARAATVTLQDRKMMGLNMNTMFPDIVLNGGRNYDVVQSISQGVTLTTRVGRDITMTGVRLSFTLESAHLHAVPIEDEYNNVRVVVALFRKPGAAQDAAYFAANTTIHSALVPEVSGGLVKIFYDKIHLLKPEYYKEGTEPRAGVKNVMAYIPLSERITFTGDGSVNAADKQVVIFMCSDSEAPPHPWVAAGNCTAYWRG